MTADAQPANWVLCARRLQALRDDGFRRWYETIDHVTKSEDPREGATEFAEVRAPEWRGR